MLNTNQLEIVTTSIEAAVQPELWNKSLDLLIDSYGGLSGNINMMDQNHETCLALATSRFIREDAYEKYEKFMQKGDANDSLAMEGIFGLPSNQMASEHDIFEIKSGEELPYSGFRNWQKKEFDIDQRYGMKLNINGPWLDAILLHYNSQKKELSKEEILEINQISSVMTSSIKTFRVMEQLHILFNSTLNALDKLGIACFLSIKNAQIIHKNQVAQDLLDDADGLSVNILGNLSAIDENLNSVITKSCIDTYQTTQGKNITSEILLSVDRPSGKPPYLLIINPIIDANAELEAGLKCAFIFVADPSVSKNISIDGLTKLGRLTKTEAAICKMLVDGFCTAHMVERRNVSENTLRKQIGIILNKLHCNSRIGLLRMAIDTRLPIK